MLRDLRCGVAVVVEDAKRCRRLDGVAIQIGEHLLAAREAEVEELGKLAVLAGVATSGEGLAASFETLAKQVHAASQLSTQFSAHLADLYHDSANKISKIIRVTVMTIIAVLLVAVILLGIFTRWISRALAKPIGEIIEQIHSVGTGDVDLTNKIQITSRDEIGLLSQEFNGLMDTVYSMTMFKKVIEEDTTLEDVYTRLGEVFRRELGIDAEREGTVPQGAQDEGIR